MNRPNPVKDKSYSFALEVITLSKKLNVLHEYILSNQLLKSGTSIGANVREALYAPSKKDFANKLSIALKESHETDYWLCLIRDADILSSVDLEDCRKKNLELIALLTAILKSTRFSLDKVG